MKSKKQVRNRNKSRKFKGTKMKGAGGVFSRPQEQKEKTEVDLKNNYIYIIIQTHGTVNFDLSIDISDKKHISSSYSPSKLLTIPDDVEYVGLITHAPLGCADIGINYSTRYITQNLVSSWWGGELKSIVGLKGQELRDKLIELDRNSKCGFGSCIRQNSIDNRNVLLEESNKERRSDSFLVNYSIFDKNPNSVYALTEYNKFTNKNNLLNKIYSLDVKNDYFSSDEKYINLVVLYEKGGLLRPGNYILGSNHYRKYYFDTGYDDDFGGEPDIDPDTDDDPMRSITTENLLHYLFFCGYKNIILIDNSCNSVDKSITRDHVRKARGIIERTKGGKKRNRKTRKHRK